MHPAVGKMIKIHAPLLDQYRHEESPIQTMIYPDLWNGIFEHYNRKDHFRFFEANETPIDPRPLHK